MAFTLRIMAAALAAILACGCGEPVERGAGPAQGLPALPGDPVGPVEVLYRGEVQPIVGADLDATWGDQELVLRLCGDSDPLPEGIDDEVRYCARLAVIAAALPEVGGSSEHRIDVEVLLPDRLRPGAPVAVDAGPEHDGTVSLAMVEQLCFDCFGGTAQRLVGALRLAHAAGGLAGVARLSFSDRAGSLPEDRRDGTLAARFECPGATGPGAYACR